MPEGLALPTFKGRPGWEFTDISSLNLAAYEPVRSAGELEGVHAEPMFDAPAGELPDGVIATSIERAVAELGRVYICGLGFFELYLNGQRVGDHVRGRECDAVQSAFKFGGKRPRRSEAARADAWSHRPIVRSRAADARV